MPRIPTQILQYCLTAIHALLERLMPLDTQTSCFYSFPDISDNADYMCRHWLLSHKKPRCVWLLSSPLSNHGKAQKAFYHSLNPNADIVWLNKNSLRGYYHYLRSAVVFHTHGVYTFAVKGIATGRKKQVINLWHGMPIKKIGALNKETEFKPTQYSDYYISSSNYYRNIIAQAFRVNQNQVLLSGQPRCDVLNGTLKPQYNRQEVLAKLDIPIQQRFILWTPTYRQGQYKNDWSDGGNQSFLDELGTCSLSQIDRLTKAHQCHIIIKLHKFDQLNLAPPKLACDNIRLMTQADWDQTQLPLYDALAHADAQLSDISSILIDYMITGKPIGLLGFNAEQYHRGLVFPLDTLQEQPSLRIINQLEDLEHFISSLALPATSPAPRFHQRQDIHSAAEICRALTLG